MKVNEAFVMFISMMQSLIGALSIIIAYLIYCNPGFLPVRSLLNLQPEHVPFFMMILSIVGFFAIISGLLIIHEWFSGK
jgi:hypothetical protein